MKKNLPAIAAVLACVLCIFCLFEISAAKNEIRDLKNDLGQYCSNYQNALGNLSASIDSQLHEQASLISSGAWEYGEADYAANTVELICAITPKEYTPGATAATIYIDGQALPMTLEGGDFRLTQTVSLFDEINVSTVQFTEGGTVRTEKLDWTLSPRYALLPSFNAFFHGDSTINSENQSGSYPVSISGPINIDFYGLTNGDSIEAIRLLEYINGKETGRTEIPLKNISHKDLAADPASATRIWSYDADGMPTAYVYSLVKDYELQGGDSFDLYVELEDSTGLLYRSLIHHFLVEEDGGTADDDFGVMPGVCSIYDKSGRLLFEPDSELYY